MQAALKTVVMKFGGAAMQTPAHFSLIAKRIIESKKTYQRVVVVLSAMGGVTDQLIDLSKQVNATPPKREYDMLVSVGERVSISLLAMALAKENIKALSFTGSQSGIITDTSHAEASIVEVRPNRIIEALEQNYVAIVAGFQGVSLDKEITTLGRGGSDTTAVALGSAINADCVEFYKDVDGIYLDNPKEKRDTTFCPYLSYQKTLEIIAKTGDILHPKSVLLAQSHNLILKIRSFLQEKECNKMTVIASETIIKEFECDKNRRDLFSTSL